MQHVWYWSQNDPWQQVSPEWGHPPRPYRPGAQYPLRHRPWLVLSLSANIENNKFFQFFSYKAQKSFSNASNWQRLIRLGKVYLGKVWLRKVWLWKIWLGKVWLRKVWIWKGLVRKGLVGKDLVRKGLVRKGLVRKGLVRKGMVSKGLVRKG